MTRLAFNHPALYVSLLSEMEHNKNGNHPVYSTVMADEFTIRTPDALMSGSATESFIKSCCPDITHPSKLLLCDLQHLLASIRIASHGTDLEVLLKCPKCSELDPYTIDLQQVLPRLSAKKWFNPLIIDGLAVSLKPPTYEDYNKYAIDDFKITKQLHQLAKMDSDEQIVKAIDNLLKLKQKLHLEWQAKCIRDVYEHPMDIFNPKLITCDSKYIFEWLEQCEIAMQKQILDYITDAKREASVADIIVKCTKCSEIFSSPIDFDVCTHFRQKLIPANESEILDIIKELGTQTKALSNELLKMTWYMRGGVSYSEAMCLTPHDRQCIAKIIEENVQATIESKMPLI